jgi:hypothetical protein
LPPSLAVSEMLFLLCSSKVIKSSGAQDRASLAHPRSVTSGPWRSQLPRGPGVSGAPARAAAAPSYRASLLGPDPPAGKRVVRPAVIGLDEDKLLAIGGDEYLCLCP